jgi:putative ABC transport system substrate-binding protein
LIDRRTFLAGTGAVLLAAPLGAEAIEAKPARIGVLSSSGPWIQLQMLKAFRESLTELAYIEGQNLAIEFRFADDRVDRLPNLAVELIALGVDVIIAIGPAVLKAAKSETATVPIVAIDFESDPIDAGFITSLARPGRNITGTFLDQAELTGKWLQLLREMNPKLSRAAVFWDSSTPSYQLNAIKAAAKPMALELHTLAIGGPYDLEGAFAAAFKSRGQAVVILSSPLVSRYGARLGHLAVMRHLPTISMFRENVVGGCLMAYGPSLVDGWRRLGSFAGRILKGARPGDLPIERPSRFEFVINFKTAKALGLTIPPSLLGRADEVIE